MPHSRDTIFPGMSHVAIIGCGPIGAGVAHALAVRARITDIRLYDGAGAVAAGKALDIRQSGPVDNFDTRVSGSGDVLGAVGATVIVLADDHVDGQWTGDRGLALITRLRAAGATAPLVLAGPAQTPLLETAIKEAGLDPSTIVGTAAAALVGAARALVALETGGTGADVSLMLYGRPPALTVGWSSATVAGARLTERVPAHRLLAIAAQLRALWPPQPFAIASATAPVVEAVCGHGRHELPAVALLDAHLGVRGAAGLWPMTFRQGRIDRLSAHTLSPQERTEVFNSLSPRG